MRAHTWCIGSGGKENTDGCYNDSLTDTSTKSLGRLWVRTHKKAGHHSGEHEFVVVPECICPDNEKTWMIWMRNTHIVGEGELHSAQMTEIKLKPVRE